MTSGQGLRIFVPLIENLPFIEDHDDAMLHLELQDMRE